MTSLVGETILFFCQNGKDCYWNGDRLSMNDKNVYICIKISKDVFSYWWKYETLSIYECFSILLHSTVLEIYIHQHLLFLDSRCCKLSSSWFGRWLMPWGWQKSELEQWISRWFASKSQSELLSFHECPKIDIKHFNHKTTKQLNKEQLSTHYYKIIFYKSKVALGVQLIVTETKSFAS